MQILTTDLHPRVTVGAGVISLLASGTVIRAGTLQGVLIAGRDVSLFNCTNGNNNTHAVADQADVQIAATADDVAIIGGMCSAYRDGDNPSYYGVQIVDGARRVRILGLDLSRNKASATGSFEITGFSDGDINISANNLQQPSSTSELLAADFYITFNLAAVVAGTYLTSVIAGQKIVVLGMGYIVNGGMGTSCTLTSSLNAVSANVTLTAGYSAFATPVIVDGTSAPQDINITVASPAGSPSNLLVTFACQSIT
jgi:hypothetical protein